MTSAHREPHPAPSNRFRVRWTDPSDQEDAFVSGPVPVGLPGTRSPSVKSRSVLAATGLGVQYHEFNISSPHRSVIELNGHPIGGIDCTFVPILRPDVA